MDIGGTVFCAMHSRLGTAKAGSRALLADGDHFEVSGPQDFPVFLLPHGPIDRDLMVVRMAREQLCVARNDGFLARLVVLEHIVVCIRSFVEAAGDADGASLLIFLSLAENR